MREPPPLTFAAELIKQLKAVQVIDEPFVRLPSQLKYLSLENRESLGEILAPDINLTQHASRLKLNELEYIKGEIYANIWQTDWIVRLDPETGNILGWIDLKNLLPTGDRTGTTDVLNGIAYDEASDRLFVTGKLWPKLFEIRLKKR